MGGVEEGGQAQERTFNLRASSGSDEWPPHAILQFLSDEEEETT